MLVIAEVGSNLAPVFDFTHWCEAVRATGADAIKTQVFSASHFPQAEQASKRPLEFPRHRLAEYMRAARAYGLIAGASVFDTDAVESVAQHCDFIKLAAREQSNTELWDSAEYWSGRHRNLIYRSITHPDYYIEREHINGLTTLFTVPKYPAGMVESVLAVQRAAIFFKRKRARWGFSSHTTGTLDCRMAQRLGASVLEKHFAVSKSNIESGHSLYPRQFSEMVRQLSKG